MKRVNKNVAMAMAVIFVLWLLTLGIFIEGNVGYIANESVSKAEFLNGENSVFVSGFVTEHDRFTYGVPFVFAANHPTSPYALHIATSVRINNVQSDSKVALSSVSLVSDGGRSEELLEPGTVESAMIAHSLFGEKVVGCNFVFDTALESHGSHRVDIAGSIDKKDFRESVEIRSWNGYSLYPGWYKLLYLDQF